MLQYNIFRGALNMISSGQHAGVIGAMDITSEDWSLFTGETPWVAADRNRIVNILHKLVFGCMDVSGCSRFNPPAEFIAAVIAVFVSPCNIASASAYMEGSMPTADSAMIGDVPEQVSAEKIFAFVCEAYSDDLGAHKRSFEEAVGKKLAHVVPVAEVSVPAGSTQRKAGK